MSDSSSLPIVTLVSLDVTLPESIQAAVEGLKKATLGKLDILVNNVGSGYTMPYLDTNVETAKNLFEVNIWGSMRITQAFQHMLIGAK
ncbi:hypothetical protein SUNI508_08316 [Seiridium unicorne]|uniref:Uncharacterized protein n=1 Tax=Seiridium unicorne TaxID=138068 RepID=A0ABR2UUA7_9PEZI